MFLRALRVRWGVLPHRTERRSHRRLVATRRVEALPTTVMKFWRGGSESREGVHVGLTAGWGQVVGST